MITLPNCDYKKHSFQSTIHQKPSDSQNLPGQLGKLSQTPQPYLGGNPREGRGWRGIDGKWQERIRRGRGKRGSGEREIKVAYTVNFQTCDAATVYRRTVR